LIHYWRILCYAYYVLKIIFCKIKIILFSRIDTYFHVPTYYIICFKYSRIQYIIWNHLISTHYKLCKLYNDKVNNDNLSIYFSFIKVDQTLYYIVFAWMIFNNNEDGFGKNVMARLWKKITISTINNNAFVYAVRKIEKVKSVENSYTPKPQRLGDILYLSRYY